MKERLLFLKKKNNNNNKVDLSEKQRLWEALRKEPVKKKKILFSPPVCKFTRWWVARSLVLWAVCIIVSLAATPPHRGRLSPLGK